MTVTIDGTNGVTSPGITDTGNLSVSGTSAFTGSVGNITAGTVTASTGVLYPIVNGTAQASTSGTSIDFASIPSWVKRVIVSLTGVSTTGTSEVIFRIGTSGGVQATGYLSSSSVITAAVVTTNDTTGFRLFNNGGAATDVRNGALTLALLDSATGTWSATGVFGQSDAARTAIIGGSKTLSGTLDRVRITTINGTDTFDAGSINIQYE